MTMIQIETVECKEQAEMHVHEKMVHEEAQTWWHKHVDCMYM